MPFLRDEQTVAVFALVLIVECALDIVASLYILRLALGDRNRPRSWLLQMLVTTTFLSTLGLVPIATLVILRASGNPPLPGNLGQIITGMGLVLAGAVPIMKAVLFALVRRDRVPIDPDVLR